MGTARWRVVAARGTLSGAGKEVFESAGCVGCHTLADAGATGTVGPNLDEAKPSEAIVVNRVTNGKGVMPSFKGQLSEQQIQAFVDAGAKLVDTAPAYGNAEANLGQLIEDLGIRNRIFLATKVPAQDSREQKEASIAGSLQRMRTRNFDLMQAWNVNDPNYDLSLVREWKAQGICRYTGITTSFDGSYGALEAVLKREKPDFFQIDYSLVDRNSEERLIPTAAEAGCAILTNLPPWPFSQKPMSSSCMITLMVKLS